MGAFIGAIIFCFYALVKTINFNDLDRYDVLICIALLAVSGWLGAAMELESSRAYIAEYQAAKYTIEANLGNDKMSDLTRMELLNKATEYNAELAGKQYSAQQWYGFGITDDVLGLEFISLE
jgi:hypothetical protein